MLNIKAKEVAPIVEQPADFSEEWPENIVEEPALDLPEPNKRKDHEIGWVNGCR